MFHLIVGRRCQRRCFQCTSTLLLLALLLLASSWQSQGLEESVYDTEVRVCPILAQ